MRCTYEVSLQVGGLGAIEYRHVYVIMVVMQSCVCRYYYVIYYNILYLYSNIYSVHRTDTRVYGNKCRRCSGRNTPPTHPHTHHPRTNPHTTPTRTPTHAPTHTPHTRYYTRPHTCAFTSTVMRSELLVTPTPLSLLLLCLPPSLPRAHTRRTYVGGVIFKGWSDTITPPTS